MALAKDPSLYSSSSTTLDHQLSDPSIYRFDHDHHHKMINIPKGYVFGSPSFDHHEQGFDGANFLSFVQNESSPDQESYTKTSEDREHDEYSSLWEGYNDSSPYGIMMSKNTPKTSSDRDMFGLSFFNDENDVAVDVETTTHVSGSNKRHRVDMGEDNAHAFKKQCNGTNNNSKKAKPKTMSTSSKDPQSLVAKNRRERISERLKVLQELVPNGCKVDLVTMLEKACSYVKFLQLQVKVLATDEFWPAQGGKAPEISQVKEAIDAILSSQRDRN